MNFVFEQEKTFEAAAEKVIELGNSILDSDDNADPWEVASGLLAGAIQFWLYSHRPCDDPLCETCVELATAEARLGEIMAQTQELAQAVDSYDSHLYPPMGNA